jgi:hypothetical protein
METDPITPISATAPVTPWPAVSVPHPAQGPPAPTKSDQTLDELAAGGDRLAIAELKRLQLKPPATMPAPRPANHYGEVVPLLGTQVDEYD